mmetsp:Transcript_51387/g.126133  ORF Transcript_51387/g.126133 Transcript_51387/m.126133 type:complete len:243 (-) Transcript_51387:42-770(-)|eukprot:CAMPEP_0198311204 /NCGR_PEP_ID=MMETSP1450-20131203/3001_1 /TAXON_ID=753684 ORGANISM="Madagascaria erythrocladiodes, Strain CCMP3234" /NCGR_SAMPLE_ID=MMETSP1450 /ASSEMBLY_ACC=CAM_ASM_001115 /LENGTH=242 /DNA_ID=CAMNT_0044014071 /DNA_START=303 /DNA_END=1031 /DNA_ORIENTATION=-
MSAATIVAMDVGKASPVAESEWQSGKVDQASNFFPVNGRAGWLTPPTSVISSSSSSASADAVEWEGDECTSHGELTENLKDKTQLVTSFAAILRDMCEKNDGKVELKNISDSTRMFFSVRKPSVALEIYVKRLIRHSRCSISVFVVALVYIDRLSKRRASLGPTELNVHRLLTTAILVAAKFVEDSHYNNAHYAQAGGVACVAEMNRLESAVLRFLSFDVFVSREDYVAARSRLLCSWKQCT